FTELKDQNIFKSVRINYDTIEWGNGADLDPELLYKESRRASSGTSINKQITLAHFRSST
ncbi:MAG: DUF2442 domain-containing protein, partial [Proteobacteria bacterium]|nr:DUF2442 domain-containing protein [Pseudomonadota bacterium]